MRPIAPSQTRPSRGFTLIELVTVVAIIAVLLGVAVPAVQEMLINQRIRTATMDTVAALLFARSEAIKQGGDVTVKPASNSTNWSTGWSVIAADGTTTMRTQDAYSSVAIGATISGGGSSLVFNRSGRIGGTASFQISAASNSSKYAVRCVTVGLNGLAKSSVGSCS